MNNNIDSIYSCIDDHLLQLECDRLLIQCERGFQAYNNATVILDVYNKHGYTDVFHELIGEETLIDTARESIVQFAVWLKEMLRKVIAYVLQVIAAIRKKLSVVFRKYATEHLITFKYDISSIEQKTPSLLNETIDFWCNRPEQIIITERELTEQFDVLKKIVSTTISSNAVTSVRLHDHGVFIQRTIEAITQPLPDNVASLSKAISQLNTTDADSARRIRGMVDLLLRTLRSMQMVEQDRVNLSDSASAIQACDTLFKLLLLKIKNIHGVSALLGDYLAKVQQAYNGSSIDIHLVIPMDKSFVKRLGLYYGGEFNVDNLIVTNRNPNTWPDPMDGSKSPITGWMYDKCAIPNIWCSYNFLISSVSRWSMMRGSKEESLIKTIVHECRHLFDIQNRIGGEFEVETGAHVYADRTYESRARYAADNYKPTPADIAFARMVLQKLDAEVRRQAQ